LSTEHSALFIGVNLIAFFENSHGSAYLHCNISVLVQVDLVALERESEIESAAYFVIISDHNSR